MTNRIPKSIVPDPEKFAASVTNFIVEKNAHDRQMEMVSAGKAQAYPAPQTHPLIEASIKRGPGGWEPDYVIWDDGPTIEQKIAEMRNQLYDQVVAADAAAAERISPPGKRRFWAIRREDILIAEAKEQGSTGINGPAARSDEDARFMEEFDERERRLNTNHRHMAKLHFEIAEIETLDGLRAWKMEPFPE